MRLLHQLKAHGQSVWLDHINRDLIRNGELKRQVDEGEIGGVIINPGIPVNAMGSINPGSGHDEEMCTLLHQGHTPPAALKKLIVPDVQAAADRLYPVYEKTHQWDGFVSLQVSPALADDTAQTVAEARRLWHEIGRKNLLIQVPATEAGIPAITQLTAEGINVNVTMLFSQTLYERVAQAYLEGLEQRIAQGGNPANVISVASFFINRIDTAVDAIITSHLNPCGWIKIYNAVERESLRNLLGKVAVANAKVAYAGYQAIFSGPPWEALAAQGARKQRLLWAGTDIENLAYRDVKYIEGLIGPETVAAISPATLAAFRDHGRVRGSLQENLENAPLLLSTLKALRISLDEIAGKLLSQGIRQSTTAYEKRLNAVQQPLP